MDLEDEGMTSLMDNSGMLTVTSEWAWSPQALLDQHWHSSNRGPTNWNHPAISKWQERDVTMDQSAVVFFGIWSEVTQKHKAGQSFAVLFSDSRTAVPGIEHVTLSLQDGHPNH